MTKVSELTRDNSPSSDDYLLTVDNATGASRKATIADVVAGVAGSGISRTVVSVTSSTTVGAAASTDYIVLIGASGAPTLPTAVGNTNRYTLKNVHTTNKTVATSLSQTIDGSTSITLTPNTSVDVVSDGSNWKVI